MDCYDGHMSPGVWLQRQICFQFIFLQFTYKKQIFIDRFKYQSYMSFITEFLQQPDKINMETISKIADGKTTFRDVE